MNRRLAIAIILGIGIGWALSPLSAQEGPPEKPAAEKEAGAPASGQAATPKAPTTVVKLVEAGAEPRRPLRFQFAAGQKQTIRLESRLAMSMKLGQFPLPAQKIPTQVMLLDMDVLSVDAAGTATIRSVVREIELTESDGIPAFRLAQFKSYLEGLKGLEGTSVVTSRGLTRNVEFKQEGTPSPQQEQQIESLRNSFQQVSNPFPEEPIGLGAKWEAHASLDQNRIKINQVTRFELTAAEVGGGTMSVEVVQSANPQKMDAPGAPPGVQVDLTSFKGGGKGTTVFDLARLAPLRADMQTVTDLASSANIGGQQQTMGMHLELAIKIGPPLPPEKADDAEEKKPATGATETGADSGK